MSVETISVKMVADDTQELRRDVIMERIHDVLLSKADENGNVCIIDSFGICGHVLSVESVESFIYPILRDAISNSKKEENTHPVMNV